LDTLINNVHYKGSARLDPNTFQFINSHEPSKVSVDGEVFSTPENFNKVFTNDNCFRIVSEDEFKLLLSELQDIKQIIGSSGTLTSMNDEHSMFALLLSEIIDIKNGLREQK
jgi:hypothetical protein